jgi:hypothetical protein
MCSGVGPSTGWQLFADETRFSKTGNVAEIGERKREKGSAMWCRESVGKNECRVTGTTFWTCLGLCGI